MLLEVSPKFPRVLFGHGFGFAAVIIENRIGRIKDPFETRNIFQQFQSVLPTHAAIIHAVFVDRRDAGIQEAFGHFAQSMEAFLLQLILFLANRIAHDTDILAFKSLHAWDCPFHFGKIKGIIDFFAPVGDGGTKAINANTAIFQFFFDQIEGFISDVVKVGLGESLDFHRACFDGVPAQFLHGLDLSINQGPRFVCNTG